MSGPVHQYLQVVAELSLAYALVGRRNLCSLVVPSMSYRIPMSGLSLLLPALPFSQYYYTGPVLY